MCNKIKIIGSILRRFVDFQKYLSCFINDLNSYELKKKWYTKDDFSYEITFVKVLTSRKNSFFKLFDCLKKKLSLSRFDLETFCIQVLHAATAPSRHWWESKENRLTKLDVKKIEEKYDVNTKPKSDLLTEKNFSKNVPKFCRLAITPVYKK